AHPTGLAPRRIQQALRWWREAPVPLVAEAPLGAAQDAPLHRAPRAQPIRDAPGRHRTPALPLLATRIETRSRPPGARLGTRPPPRGGKAPRAPGRAPLRAEHLRSGTQPWR